MERTYIRNDRRARREGKVLYMEFCDLRYRLLYSIKNLKIPKNVESVLPALTGATCCSAVVLLQLYSAHASKRYPGLLVPPA